MVVLLGVLVAVVPPLFLKDEALHPTDQPPAYNTAVPILIFVIAAIPIAGQNCVQEQYYQKVRFRFFVFVFDFVS